MADGCNRIASFSVDHDRIVPGVYLSRTDGDIATYDLRTRTPNQGDYMDNLTMHSVEHMFATFARNSEWRDHVIYFGPMGCQTGFYLLLRDMAPQDARQLILDTLQRIIEYRGPMFGAARKECGNYKNLSLEAAQTECASYLKVVQAQPCDFRYPQAGGET